jgi:hypothetical protein
MKAFYVYVMTNKSRVVLYTTMIEHNSGILRVLRDPSLALGMTAQV